MIEHAILLSAGQGSRMLPLTAERPKCLIDFSGKSLIAWQIEMLARGGVKRIDVVTGFMTDMVDAHLAEIDDPRVTITTVFNPFYKVADNLASCWMARGELRGDCLLINGDTLFEPAIARRLLDAPAAPITLTIDRKPRYDDDDMKVITEGERLRAVGKKLTDGVNGESIGFSRFQGEGAALFVAELERTMRTKEGTGLWYLSAMNRLAGSGADVRVVSIEGLDWGELDFAADLAPARALAAAWQERDRTANVA